MSFFDIMAECAKFAAQNIIYCTMRKVILLFSALFMSLLPLNAQRARFELSFQPAFQDEAKVYVMPREKEDVKSPVLRFRDGKYTAGVPLSDTGFYDIVVVKDNAQLMTTIYVADADKVKFDVALENRVLKVSDTPDNRALSAFNAFVADNARTLWTRQGMSGDEFRAMIASYDIVADSLAGAEKVSEPVAEFLNVWAYIAAYDAYTSIPRAQNIGVQEVGFGFLELLQPEEEALDNDYSPLFYSTFRIIAENMPAEAGNLLDKLEILHNYYRNESVREMARSKFIDSFLSKHNYSADFEGGLATIEKVTEIYGLSDVYVKEYLKRKAAIVGSPFPAGIVLEDADGNIVDFASFKGKYVYVDLWASWCGPCCKEVPHLQALEKDMQGSNVVFLSISTDVNKEAWKKKMTELGMHGHQLRDRDDALCNALGVKGIPFFLIYDKDGNLHTYGAMRPSKGEVLKNFLKALE